MNARQSQVKKTPARRDIQRHMMKESKKEREKERGRQRKKARDKKKKQTDIETNRHNKLFTQQYLTWKFHLLINLLNMPVRFL